MPQILGPEVPVPSDGSSHRLPTRERRSYVVPNLHNVLTLASGDNLASAVLDDVVIRVPRSAKLEHAVVRVAVSAYGTLEVVVTSAIVHASILARVKCLARYSV